MTDNRETIVRQIQEKWREVDVAAGAVANRRIELGRLLLALKGSVSHGDWEVFYRKNFPGRTLRDAQKCMKLAGSDDPAGLAEKEREAERERSRGRREAEKRRPTAAFENTPLARIEAAHPTPKGDWSRADDFSSPAMRIKARADSEREAVIGCMDSIARSARSALQGAKNLGAAEHVEKIIQLANLVTTQAASRTLNPEDQTEGTALLGAAGASCAIVRHT